MKIFLISPVRAISEIDLTRIRDYVKRQEKLGHQVYFPIRDTNQNDKIGLRICRDNRKAIEDADEIHIWWNEESQGSLFDFGIAFGLKKKIVLINSYKIQPTSEKSFDNVLFALQLGEER